MRALFLGAGASYEVGMPLVWEFTNTLRVYVLKYLDTKQFDFQGDAELKKRLFLLFSDSNIHYEQVVAELEKLYQSLRANLKRQDIVYGVIVQLIECIQLLLSEDQLLTLKLLTERIKHYSGLINFLNTDGATFVYSLNHDMVFEEICSYLRINFKDGFYNDPRQYGHLAPFSSISSNQLESGDLSLYSEHEVGVNLIKLHGSLDIFCTFDKKYFLKVKGSGKSVGSHLAAAMKIEECNQKICVRDEIRAVNMLCVEDLDGKIQFLRRSLLSGGNKFKDRIPQIAPKALLKSFKNSLPSVNELTVIGYSFGDEHINDILVKWISEGSRKIVIYDPNINKPLNIFDNFKSKVCLMKGSFTDFCLNWDSSTDSSDIKVMRMQLDIIRDRLKERREKQT